MQFDHILTPIHTSKAPELQEELLNYMCTCFTTNFMFFLGPSAFLGRLSETVNINFTSQASTLESPDQENYESMEVQSKVLIGSRPMHTFCFAVIRDRYSPHEGTLPSCSPIVG